MQTRPFVFAAILLFLGFAAPIAAHAQTLSPDYRALLRDAAQFEDGAHFAATVRLVARNAEGGASGVIAALEEESPDLAAQARAILGPDPTPAGPVVTEAAGAAPAGGASPEAEAATAVASEARRRGILPGIMHALFGEPDDPVWTGKLRGGVRLDSGNNDQKDYTFGLEAQRALVGWGFRTTLDYSYSEANERISRDDFKAETLAERELGERWTTFLRTELRRDRLSSYEYTAFGGAGFGYRLFEMPSLNWTLRAAPGVRHRQPEEGDGVSSLAADFTSDVTWRIDDRFALSSRSSLIVGDAGQLEQILGLTSNIAGGWGAEARYSYRYDFDPLPGFQRTDRRLDLSLVKEF